MDEWIRQAIKHSADALWNNGSYGIRNMRGGSSLSVHACGRAVDLSYRPSEKHPDANRKAALAFLDIVLMNANGLGVEQVLDYFPQPFGRGWRCDRQAWSRYSNATIHGAPGGDWFHIEINPRFADSKTLVKQAFDRIFLELPH